MQGSRLQDTRKCAVTLTVDCTSSGCAAYVGSCGSFTQVREPAGIPGLARSMPSAQRFASHGSRAVLPLLLLPLLSIHQCLARVAFVTSLSAETYHNPSSTSPALKLTCAMEGSSNDSISINWFKAGMDRMYTPSSQPADVYNVSSSTGDVMAISTLMLDGAQLLSQSISFVQCSNGAGLNSSTQLRTVFTTSVPCGGSSSTQMRSEPSGCTCAPCPSSTSTVAQPTDSSASGPRVIIGDETVFWSVVGAGSLGWAVCLLCIICAKCGSSNGGSSTAPTSASPRQQQPNNLRGARVAASTRIEEQRRRHEAVEVRRRSALDLMHAGDTTEDGTLFTNPLFESDSLARQQQQQQQQQQQRTQQPQQQQQLQQQQHHQPPQANNMLKRPPLPLPSEMDDPAAAWPHAQGLLTASASQPHLQNSMPELQHLPPSLPRPGGLSVDTRPQALLPPSATKDTPPKTLPRSISAEPKPLVSPTRPVPPQGLELGLGRQSSQAQDVQPPAIPTTQRPTLPRPTRSSIDLTHDPASPGQPPVQLPPHKRDSSSSPNWPAPMLQDRSAAAAAVDDGLDDYLTPSNEPDGGGWTGQYTAGQPQPGRKEYIILSDGEAVADGGTTGGAYMDMVGVQSSMPQLNLLASPTSDTERLINKKAMDIPRRVRRPSSPSGAPQFRRSKVKL